MWASMRRSCSSKPLRPFRWMSSTRQLIRSRCSEARNSSAEPNVLTLKPAAPSSLRTALRMEASSSTMPMTGVIAVSFRRSSACGDSPSESVCSAGIERYGALVVWGRPFRPSVPHGLGRRELFAHPDQVGDRVRLHLLHDAAAVDLDGLLRDAELVRDLLVQHSRHHEH